MLIYIDVLANREISEAIGSKELGEMVFTLGGLNILMRSSDF